MSSNSETVIKGSSFQIAKANDLMDLDVAKRCTEVLDKHYPGYLWGVNANSETGMVHVRNFTLAGEWGFNLHMQKVQEDVEGKLMKWAGGEILERFRAHRGRVKQAEVDELKTDRIGRVLVDKVGATQEWQ